MIKQTQITDVVEPGWKSEDFEVTLYPPTPTTGWLVGMPKGVKVLHKPTGLFATSEEERSQHRNRDVAWNKLQEMLAAHVPAESVGRKEIIVECRDMFVRGSTSWELLNDKLNAENTEVTK